MTTLKKCLGCVSGITVGITGLYLYSHNVHHQSLRSLILDRAMRVLGFRQWQALMKQYPQKSERLLRHTNKREHLISAWRIGLKGKQSRIGEMQVMKWHLPDSRHERAILYLHGGGYIMGATPFHFDFIHDMMRGSRSDIIYPIYFKAPSYTYHDSIGPLIQLYQDLVLEYGTENLFVMGDSAGGGLAMSLLMTLRDQGVTMPQHLILISPWLDMVMDHPEYHQYDQRDPFLNYHAMQVIGRYWAGEGNDLASPAYSPINGQFAGLPPIYCVAGTYDLLYVDTQRLQEKLQACQHPHLIRYGERMNHIYPILPVREALFIRREICAIINGNKF